MRISDWSSDVCSSDLQLAKNKGEEAVVDYYNAIQDAVNGGAAIEEVANDRKLTLVETPAILPNGHAPDKPDFALPAELAPMVRSEEHTSELQSLMRISYAVFCLKKKTQITHAHNDPTH